ncbi:MAG: hypothetical protein IKV44_03990 [Clostridia bacterium]|nr:hypothetical protein [Clostridia bacterium]
MKLCNACGASVEDGALKCPQCESEDIVDAVSAAIESAPEEETAQAEPEITEAEVTEEPQEEATEEAADEATDDGDATDAAADGDATDAAADGEDADEIEATEESDDAAVADEDEESSEESQEAEDADGEYDEPHDDDLDYQEPRALDKKKIAIIAGSVLGAVAVIVAVICLFTFVDFDRNRAYDLKEKTFVAEENVTGDPVAPIPFVSNPAYEMSERFSDYQVSINGAVYQVPMSVEEIINSGWIFGQGEDSTRTLPTEGTADTFFVSKDGAVMYATVINFNKAETALSKCYVSRLKVDYADNLLIDVKLTGGLAFGRATRAQVEEIIGESSDAVELASGIVVTYKSSDKARAVVTYNAKTSVLEGIEFINTKKPGNYQEVTEADADNNADNAAAGAPLELGTDFTSGVVQIEGDLYTLPIKVNDLLKNGWEISFKEDRAILYGGEHLIATFTRGDVTITGVDVHNQSDDEKLIKNCEIIEMSSSPDDEYSVVFPANVKAGMSEADFKAAIQGKKYEFNEVNFDEYVFYNGAYTFMVVVDKDEAAVNYVLLTYEEK